MHGTDMKTYCKVYDVDILFRSLDRPYVKLFFFFCILLRLIKIKEWVDKNDPGAVIIPFSGVFENRLLEMSDEERKLYLEEVKATRWVWRVVARVHEMATVEILLLFCPHLAVVRRS